MTISVTVFMPKNSIENFLNENPEFSEINTLTGYVAYSHATFVAKKKNGVKLEKNTGADIDDFIEVSVSLLKKYKCGFKSDECLFSRIMEELVK
jgi:hypothetical protein